MDAARLRDFLDPRPSLPTRQQRLDGWMLSGWRRGSLAVRASGTVGLFWAACRLAENGVRLPRRSMRWVLRHSRQVWAIARSPRHVRSAYRPPSSPHPHASAEPGAGRWFGRSAPTVRNREEPGCDGVNRSRAALGPMTAVAGGDGVHRRRAFWLSFTSLADLAARSGIGAGQAWAWPLIVDGIIVVATVAVVALAGQRSAWYPWALLVGGALVSVTANAIHAVVAADADVPGCSRPRSPRCRPSCCWRSRT